MSQSRNGDSLSRKVVKGGAWVLGLRIIEKGIGMAKLIILARLLDPNDFGLFGIALLSISIMEIFSQTGFHAALVQKKNEVSAYLDTAWTISAIRGALLAALLLICAPYIASFFNSRTASPVIQIIAVSFFLQGLTNTGIVYFQKELEFNKQFIYQSGGAAVDFIVTIIAALFLKSVWALVLGALAGDFTRLVLSYAVHPYRPKLSMSVNKAKELFGFGRWVSASGILIFLVTQGDDMFIGKILGITALGFYQMAYKISHIPVTEISHAISSVTFPAYSRMQDNIPRLRESYLRVLKLTAFLSFPIAGLIFALAPDFTRLFLGDKWMPMVPAMQVLAVAGLFRALAATSGYIFYAVGEPKTDTKWQLARFLVLAVLIYPLTIKEGITGASVAVLLSIITSSIGFGFSSARITGCRAGAFGKIMLIPLMNGLAAVLLVSGLKTITDGGAWGFIACVLTGVSAYLVMTRLSDKYFNYMMYPAINDNFKMLRGV
ncbi:MAG: lipopolysaccharide biosynthesis protein [Deltaproteobacteria bacterium]|nr:lipopolysaccharide biosynthesis protein [Deltaproteobacteria bacterium]